MRKTEFMDLLKYYFRNEDKGDLKGILEDCEEQFHLGTIEGKTQEEICAELGHPKNIYRYYIGVPIIQADNDSLRQSAAIPGYVIPSASRQAPYDRDKEPAQPHYTTSAAKTIASPFLDIMGTLLGIFSGFLYLCTALAVLACIGISFLPSYIYTDMLPLPTLSMTTMIFTILAILFAALTVSYASEACHNAAYTSSGKRRRA